MGLMQVEWRSGIGVLGLAIMGCGTSPMPEGDSDELEEALNGEPAWAMWGRTARRTSNNPLESVIGVANVASLVETWSVQEQGSHAPAIALWGSRLFVSNLMVPYRPDPSWGNAFVLHALDPDSGTRYWEAPLPEDQNGSFSPEPFTSEMAVGFGRIHIQHVNFSPLISTKTGKVVGRSALKTGMDDRASAPLLKGNTLVLETAGEYYNDLDDYRRTVFATDATTNVRLWRKAVGPASEVPRNPALGSGVVFTVDSSTNSLIALKATDGATVWTSAAAAGGLGSPSVVNGRVYAVSRPNTLRAYDALTGAEVWATVHTGGAANGAPERAPVLGSDTAYIALDKSGGGAAVGAFKTANGKRRWSVLLPASAGTSTAMSLANGVLYVGSSSGQLYTLNAATGVILATFVLASAVRQVIVADGRMHVASQTHGVHTFELPAP